MSDTFHYDEVKDATVTLLDDGEWKNMGRQGATTVTAKAIKIETGGNVGGKETAAIHWSETSIAFTFRISPNAKGPSQPVDIESLEQFFQIFKHSRTFVDDGETTIEWSTLKEVSSDGGE